MDKAPDFEFGDCRALFIFCLLLTCYFEISFIIQDDAVHHPES